MADMYLGNESGGFDLVGTTNIKNIDFEEAKISKEDYEKLSEEEKKSGIYLVTGLDDTEDGGGRADLISYDNTNSGLGSTNVQGAIDELNSNLSAGELQFKFATDGEGNYGYLGADGSLIPFKNGNGFTTLSALFQHYYTSNQNKTYTATKDCTVLAISLQTTHGGDGSGGYKSTLTTTGEMLSSNKYRKGGYMDGTFRAVDMDVALIKLTNRNTIKMVTPACANACTVMQVFELT